MRPRAYLDEGRYPSMLPLWHHPNVFDNPRPSGSDRSNEIFARFIHGVFLVDGKHAGI